jgi:hypothetical protein
VETMDWVWMQIDKDAHYEGGSAWKANMKLRFLHARVRYHLTHGRKWDIDGEGYPINQEDLAYTLLAFSLQVIRGVETCGLKMSVEQMENYVHFWRFIGFQLGIHDVDQDGNHINPHTLEESIRSFDSIMIHTCHETGSRDEIAARLTYNAMMSLGEYAIAERYFGCIPLRFSYYSYIIAARQMQPEPYADALSVEPLSYGNKIEYISTLILLQLFFKWNWLMCALISLIPSLRPYILERNRRNIHEYVLLQTGGKRSTFGQPDKNVVAD